MKGKDKMEEKKIDERYAAASHVPKRVLKTIDVGRLKGKSDINPQWKISLMTEIYGMCGIGWKFEVTEKNTVTINTGEVMLFMTVAVYIKNDEKWSDPVYGMGGDFIVKKERTGLHANDEAYKMCLTDALGNALKYIGVAADVYEQLKTRNTRNVRLLLQMIKKKRKQRLPIFETTISCSILTFSAERILTRMIL